jgi:hypothetical protein
MTVQPPPLTVVVEPEDLRRSQDPRLGLSGTPQSHAVPLDHDKHDEIVGHDSVHNLERRVTRLEKLLRNGVLSCGELGAGHGRGWTAEGPEDRHVVCLREAGADTAARQKRLRFALHGTHQPVKVLGSNHAITPPPYIHCAQIARSCRHRARGSERVIASKPVGGPLRAPLHARTRRGRSLQAWSRWVSQSALGAASRRECL